MAFTFPDKFFTKKLRAIVIVLIAVTGFAYGKVALAESINAIQTLAPANPTELLPVLKTLSIVVSDETGGGKWYAGVLAESTSLRRSS